MIPKRGKVLVITGPTATGKTDLGLKLARQLEGELVSCDSRQVYLGLDLGAGKYPTSFQNIIKNTGFWLVDGVYIWGYDLKYPTEQFNAFDFLQYAKLKITEIIGRGHLPIIVGGTGLYLKALLDGLSLTGSNLEQRAKLEQLSLQALQLKLRQTKRQAFENLNPSDLGNKRRLIRQLELAKTQGFAKKPGIKNRYDILQIGLTAPRDYLYQKVESKVDLRFERGMLEEVETLIARGLLKRLNQLGLEYRYLSQFLNGQIADLATLKLILKTKIRNFVKRQLTWFKKQPEINWFDITKPGYITDIVSQVQIWYHK